MVTVTAGGTLVCVPELEPVCQPLGAFLAMTLWAQRNLIDEGGYAALAQISQRFKRLPVEPLRRSTPSERAVAVVVLPSGLRSRIAAMRARERSARAARARYRGPFELPDAGSAVAATAALGSGAMSLVADSSGATTDPVTCVSPAVVPSTVASSRTAAGQENATPTIAVKPASSSIPIADCTACPDKFMYVAGFSSTSVPWRKSCGVATTSPPPPTRTANR